LQITDTRGYQQLLITSLFYIYIIVLLPVAIVNKPVHYVLLSSWYYYPEKLDARPLLAYICKTM